MNQKTNTASIWKRRLALAFAMVVCFLVSSVESTSNQDKPQTASHQSSESSQDTLVELTVDAVVPFALELTQTVLYFIYDAIGIESTVFVVPTITLPAANPLTQILFERIISTQGP